jgi:predicted component of type VI protein secretion system
VSGGRRLARHVHVRDERGRPHVFGPSDELPAWAAAKITSRTAWASDPAAPSASDTPADTAADQPEQPRPPARSGRGSSTAAWAAHAEALGVEIPADADRDDIVEAIRAAGHPIA